MEASKYLTANDFKGLGLLAKHCDLEKLEIAINEAFKFDIIPLFCFDFVNDVLDNWSNGDYKDLINESKYQLSGRFSYSFGFKTVWVYYAYSRYVLINNYNDTANGLVQKNNEWSIPTPLKEITDISNNYRVMGKEAFESVYSFLCVNRSRFPKFNAKDCSGGCNDDCNGGETKKIRGAKYKIISR
ncbi:hypothetical protein NNL19_02880 [Riemerella anatipestifer]|uniref:DUF6712 family protein n=1 Tax=Riemerella anatipestifer TaxID=34085 RepID=UPI0012ADF82D|nr:hypothetical protein [Riemerella anatipestifer]MCQ4154543.1 hypothetical protein [Riemerella anatipestifer]MCQ4180536.1 hypothetical protein [Riemerella anatipestifer]MDR7693210.1 hypothetical protein [Riemerella anatipestifer]MDR7793412.1 hypothetical protein [Riemerella anatipestifer]MDY3400782.1 hypothetical protein [Riemerella anatipestifer]